MPLAGKEIVFMTSTLLQNRHIAESKFYPKYIALSIRKFFLSIVSTSVFAIIQLLFKKKGKPHEEVDQANLHLQL
jgi:hypothetical protein